MRYVLYFLTLALVFVGGMLVGNIYLPESNTSIAAAISVPDPAQTIPQLKEISLDKASRNLFILGEALNACPVVVTEEKDHLLAEINLLLARQEFEIKKALFELEIAKNTPGSAVTPQFAQASADYAAAQEKLQALALILYPPEPQTPQEQPAETQAQEEQPAEGSAQTEGTASAKKEEGKTPDVSSQSAAAAADKKTDSQSKQTDEKPAEPKDASAKPAEEKSSDKK